MHARNLKLALVLVLFAGVSVAFAHSAGPSPGYTGAPGEFTCRQCHNSFSLNDGVGDLTLEGVPATYEPGETYTITVRLMRTDRSRWGFQLTALTAALEPAGTFALVDTARTQIKTDDGKSYVSHKTQGTFAGTTGGATWTVRWTAPGPGAGPVDFYVAGNASNNNNGQNGDNIYTTFSTSNAAVDEVPFEDVTAASGLAAVPGGTSVAWADFDVDGDQDFYVPGPAGGRLYRNDNGTFMDVSGGLGLDKTEETIAAAWGSFCCGRPSLLITTPTRIRLYASSSSGFDDFSAFIGPTPGRATLAAWASFDGDPFVDLFVGYDTGAVLFYNKGDSGLLGGPGGIADAQVAAWVDYDGDGRLDLFVATPTSALLYHNRADFQFDDVAGEAGLSGAAGASDAVWADYDGDGRLDLFVATPGGLKLYRNTKGGFTDATSIVGLGGIPALAVAVDDADGDGRVDLLVTNADGVQLKRFDGSAFVDKTSSIGVEHANAVAATWADTDGDGNVDLFLISPDRITLWRNPSDAATLTVRATGFGGDMAGATVTMDEDGDFATGTRQVRLISGGGARSQPPARANFATPFPDSVTIRATFADGEGREATASTGAASTATLDEPQAPAVLSAVSYKLKNGTDKLLVDGEGMTTFEEVVEVDGVRMDTTKYPKAKRTAGQRSTRIVGTDSSFDALVPRGVLVYITVFNPPTGERSAPIPFTRE